MTKIEIIEAVLQILKKGSIGYSELYSKRLEIMGVRKSELATCIKELNTEGITDYTGNYDDSSDIVLTRIGEEALQKHGSYAKYLKANAKETLWDKTIRMGKNNPVIVIVALIIGGLGVTAAVHGDIGSLFTSDSLAENVPVDSVRDTVTITKTDTLMKIDTVKVPNPNRSDASKSADERSSGGTGVHDATEAQSPAPAPVSPNDCTATPGFIFTPAIIQHITSSMQYPPQVFIPGSDKNNVYRPVATRMKTYEFVIRNSLGKEVFRTTDTKIGWNGKNTRGEVCPAGTYKYSIRATGVDKKVWDKSENFMVK